jgi:hypothetical protein
MMSTEVKIIDGPEMLCSSDTDDFQFCQDGSNT